MVIVGNNISLSDSGLPCLSASFLESLAPGIVFGVALCIVFVLGWIIFILVKKKPEKFEKSPSRSSSSSGGSHEFRSRETQPSFDLPQGKELLPTLEECAKLEESSPRDALNLWQRLGAWQGAARCLKKIEDWDGYAKTLWALGQFDQAQLVLEESIWKSPTNEKARLLLIKAYMGKGETKKAMDLIQAVSRDNSPIHSSLEFINETARLCEAHRHYHEAEFLYFRLTERDEGYPEAQQRLQAIRQMKRLKALRHGKEGEKSSARMLLQKVAQDSGSDRLTNQRAMRLGASNSDPTHSLITSSEVLVGHMALGFTNPEPVFPEGSVYSPSKRFYYESLLEEKNTTTVFKAIDRLTDCPVVIRYTALPADFEGLDILKERLLSIARISHPHIAKIMYADRDGVVVRMASEYLSGGNLHDFLKKIGGAGTPLLIRIALQIASALHRSHVIGVPHGDIRPENLILGADQRIKLCSFALLPIPVLPVRVGKDEQANQAVRVDQQENALMADAIRADLLQFGDLLTFLLEYNRKANNGVENQDHAEAIGGVHQLMKEIVAGNRYSILEIRDHLKKLFETALPQEKQVVKKKTPVPKTK
jgi:Protein kinase domain/Tetratricopeptide repeat